MSSFSFKQLQDQAKEAGIGEPLPPGRYTVKAVEATAGRTKAGDKDKIDVKFSVVSGPHANRKLFNQYTISPDNNNALAFFFRHMAAFGLGSDFFASEPTIQQVASALIDKVVDVDVIIDTYDNQDRNKIKNTLKSSDLSASNGSSVPFGQVDSNQSTPAMPSAPF